MIWHSNGMFPRHMTHRFAGHRQATAIFALLAAAMSLQAVAPAPAAALELICDPAHQDCREPLIKLIDQETVRIDVAFWFMEDLRYSSALHRARARGVQIRVLMDSRANPDYPGNVFALEQLVAAGIPMRQKISAGILHWKMMLFAGQRTVQFSGANFSDEAFVPITPWTNYVDEIIYFTDRASWVESFMTKFDDVWTSTTEYEDYANVTAVGRAYATFPIDPELNFPPGGFRERSVGGYMAETQRIDSLMFRITDRAHTDALIEMARRGVPTRLVTEQLQYREERRLWHAWNVDRLWTAGRQYLINGLPSIQVRLRRHAGLSHEKLTILRGQQMAIFGSSNWTSPSADEQLEHNAFTTIPSLFIWSRDHFDRKWNNRGGAAETKPFAPIGPDTPVLVSPAPGVTNQSLTPTLTWQGGPWAHRYDLYVGTDLANLARIVNDSEFGPYEHSWTLSTLSPATTYYWRVVGRTMANLSRTSVTCAFKTAGAGGGTPMTSCINPPPETPDPVATPEPQDINPIPDPQYRAGTPDSPSPGPGTSDGSGNRSPDPTRARTLAPSGELTGKTAVPRR